MATTKIPIGKFPTGAKVITVIYDVENDVILNQEAIFEKMEGIPNKDIIFEVTWDEIDGDDAYYEYLRFSREVSSPNHGEDDVNYYYYTFENHDYTLRINDLFDTKTIEFSKKNIISRDVIAYDIYVPAPDYDSNLQKVPIYVTGLYAVEVLSPYADGPTTVMISISDLNERYFVDYGTRNADGDNRLATLQYVNFTGQGYIEWYGPDAIINCKLVVKY